METEPKEEYSDAVEQLPLADMTSVRPSKPVYNKSDTFNSLSAIEEGMSLVSGADTGVERPGTGPPQPSTGKEKQPEKLEYEQSVSSWMSSAAKYHSPVPSTVAVRPPGPNDIESQAGNVPAEVFENAEEVDHINRPPVSPATQNKASISNAMTSRSSVQPADYETLFEILLRYLDLQSEVPASTKANSNKSFISRECSGSLSFEATLHSLCVEKHEADPLYTRESSSQRKKKSAKTRKQRSFYSSLEHAREPRLPDSLNAATWPYGSMASNIHSTPPILMCRNISLKSSTVESEIEAAKEGKSVSMEGSLDSGAVLKKSTLNVGVVLSLESVVQHVDIALIRLIHQISQISDSVQQAKTDIQVNKYTEGSVSPDIKVLHRRADSLLSGASQITDPSTPDIKRLPSIEEIHQSDSEASNKLDNSDADSTSTASTEVAQCWQVMYKMVDLSNPDQKADVTSPVASQPDTVRIESEAGISNADSDDLTYSIRRPTFSIIRHDPYVSLVLRATASAEKVRVLAAVGDLSLEAEITNILSQVHHSKTVSSAIHHNAASEFQANLNSVTVKLVDKANMMRRKTIAESSVQSSSLTASTDHKRNSQGNVCQLHLGLISFDLSQHPASLHDVVSRGTRQLSVHISEFAQTPSVRHAGYFDTVDSQTPLPPATPIPSSTLTAPMTPMTPSALTMLIDLSQDSSSAAATTTPVNARFDLKSDGILVMATLLPSLRAQYRTGEITGNGRTGREVTFLLEMPEHVLQFSTVSSPHEDNDTPPTIIHLPQIDVEGEYKQAEEERNYSAGWKEGQSTTNSEGASGNLRLRTGDYLFIAVKIGSFEHCLTTDLLNQLMFLQDVFVKEINEMVDKVSKSTKPVPLWSETSLRSEEASNEKPLLYQLKLTLQGIQITAATLSCNAVRLKTGEMMFELSNRVIQNKRTKKKKKGLNVPKYLKLFGKAQVDMTLSLGMLVRNSVYPEAEDEFQQFAYFTTRIGLQNTRQGKGDLSESSSATDSRPHTTLGGHDFLNAENLRKPSAATPTENSIVLISLKRPIFFIQPTAFDKAILIYLSYKNAYEDWREQQHNVLKMARQVRDVLHPAWSQSGSTASVPGQASQSTSTIFLQLSVNDLGICLPVTQDTQLHEVTTQDELSTALVLTIDSTLISAYYSRSLVTKGYLKGFCLRFADDFQTSWDDWKQNVNTGVSWGPIGGPAPTMNACIVPEGTYEICSDTTTYNSHLGGPPVAKTTVNVLWKMRGVDVHLDTKIGSYFSRLSNALMVITGQDELNEEDLDIQMISKSEIDEPTKSDIVDTGGRLVVEGRRSRSTTVTSTASTSSMSLKIQKERTRKIEHELNEQVKVVNDLKQLGAKQSVILEEEQRMHDLEAALSSNFRRVVRSRFRRTSINAGSKKDRRFSSKFQPTHHRARSATIQTTPAELSPLLSKLGRSTLPRQLTDGTWVDVVQGSKSNIEVTSYHGAATSPLDNDNVFPPTPVKVVDSGRTSAVGFQRSKSDSTSSDEEQEDDEVDYSPRASKSSSSRRALYSRSSNPSDQIQPRLILSKSETHLPNNTQTSSAPEADLLLELDVRVELDGGKIECHPHLEELETPIRPEYGMMPPMYGNVSKAKSYVKNTTVFYIPGVDVKVSYSSAKTDASLNLAERRASKDQKAEGMSGTKERKLPTFGSFRSRRPQKIAEEPAIVPEIEVTTPSNFPDKEDKFDLPEVTDKSPGSSSEKKRACVYAWLSLQSLPEMVISPYLLDFLEQTLGEIPSNTPSHSFSQKHSTTSSQPGSLYDSFEDDEVSEDKESDKEQIQDGSVLSSESALVSLPLDVIVSVNVQPSQVRFNCLPMSRVECLFQIPSMDLAFSSVQDDIALQTEDVANKKKPQETKYSEQKSTDSSGLGSASVKPPSGLSFSAILYDFSVYVFHPYGGKQPADPMGSFSTSPMPGANDSPFLKSGSGRRDSLSVNLEFVKVNLVRRRKGETLLVADVLSPGGSSRVDDVAIHLSGLMDVGTASFKYDMRRLGEILAFPRAWYRRSIARRMFLGDTSEQTTSSPKLNRMQGPTPSKLPHATKSRSHTNPADNSFISFLTVDSPLSPHRPLTPRNSHLHGTSSNYTASAESPPEDEADVSSLGTTGPAKWHAVVLFGLNMARLDVEMNMSNVMGNTLWSCDALRSQGRFMFQSNGDKEVVLTCSVDNSQLTAKGGIIGGQVELQRFNADCHLLDPANGDPLHKLGMRADSIDGRIEYMGGCIMIGQLTHVDLKLKDEWRDPKQSIPISMDKGSVFVHCDLGWRVFQLAISRSTTPDVIKMLSKLEEFFSQQLHSSVRALSSWTQNQTALSVSPKKVREPNFRFQDELKTATNYDHRRHWPPVFKAVAETLAKTEEFVGAKPRGNNSFLLGGSACLHGDGLIVVCFHGANFRSRSWVLFNILQPNIVFSTEVQEIKESISGDETSTLAIQSLTVNLGHDLWLSRTMKATDPMATVSRVTRSRNQNPPPGSASIAEWFAYVTASHNEELKMLRTLNDLGNSGRGGTGSSPASKVSSPMQRSGSSGSLASYSHEADIIFALPKVQLDFKTEHVQGPTEPDPEDVEPVVECSFVTEFTDHICVTMDVELILFLHDLVSSYLKEKQQALSSRSKHSSLNVNYRASMDGSFTTDEKVAAETVDPIDIRKFVCNTWQLEPTVRLISWAGRRIEPVGVDYILQKLGFQHARTTIPKWFQRGVLDMLDKGLAAIVQKLVVAILTQQKQTERQ